MISSVNVTKSALSCGFGRIYWKNLEWTTSFFVQWNKRVGWNILVENIIVKHNNPVLCENHWFHIFCIILILKKFFQICISLR